MKQPPFILIKGELVQQTATSLGGNGESNWVDHVLCRDGQERYTLRGETLAGALMATARKLYSNLPIEIEANDKKQPSVWRLFTSHPKCIAHEIVRQNVRIHGKTGAAVNGGLFDSENLPPGTRWSFVLEIDLSRSNDNYQQIIDMTLQTLRVWANGYCWLGRSVSRGTGWFCLEKTQIAKVGWEQWPNSNINNVSEYFDSHFTERAQSLCEISNTDLVSDGGWQWHEFRLTLTVGESSDNDYGINFLSIGGHSGDSLLLDIQKDLIDQQRLLLPDSKLSSSVTERWLADHVFAYTREQDAIKPYIPGSSIRGVLRHAAEWWANKHGLSMDHLDEVFGTMTDKPKAGALLVSDAQLSSDNWQAALLKMHAEDEFSGGVYESALFDRLVLTQAQFTARLVLEARQSDIKKLHHALTPAFKLAQQGFIGLGGQTHRGLGRLHWQIEEINGVNLC